MLSLLLSLVLLLPGTALAQQVGQPGPNNAITDVGGVKVGQYEQIGDGYLTGVTVVVTEDGAKVSGDIRGGGASTRMFSHLAPGGLVEDAHAVVLSGGSGWGLDTARGAAEYLESQGIGFPTAGGGRNPIIPGAILFDLGRGGDFQARPDAEFGRLATQAATDGPVAQGNVGAGTGARSGGGLRGGVGTASIQLNNGVVVGAIVAVNSVGAAVNPQDCKFYADFLEIGDEFGLRDPLPEDCPGLQATSAVSLDLDVDEAVEGETYTTIAVVATNAPLNQTHAQRFAQTAHNGLARAILPIHTLSDGDTIFSLATGTQDVNLSNNTLNSIYNAGANTLSRAVVHALINAEDGAGRVSYCGRYPSACADGPQTTEDCLEGRWQHWGFSNQGECVASVNPPSQADSASFTGASGQQPFGSSPLSPLSTDATGTTTSRAVLGGLLVLMLTGLMLALASRRSARGRRWAPAPAGIEDRTTP